MPTIRWKRQVKLENKAVGLPGSGRTYPPAGTEMEVPADAIDKIKATHGEDSFEVLAPKTNKPAAKAEGGKK